MMQNAVTRRRLNYLAQALAECKKRSPDRDVVTDGLRAAQSLDSFGFVELDRLVMHAHDRVLEVYKRFEESAVDQLADVVVCPHCEKAP